jgi:hypothetical protein
MVGGRQGFEEFFSVQDSLNHLLQSLPSWHSRNNHPSTITTTVFGDQFSLAVSVKAKTALHEGAGCSTLSQLTPSVPTNPGLSALSSATFVTNCISGIALFQPPSSRFAHIMPNETQEADVHKCSQSLGANRLVSLNRFQLGRQKCTRNDVIYHRNIGVPIFSTSACASTA